MDNLDSLIEAGARAICVDRGQDPDVKVAPVFATAWEEEARRLRPIFVALAAAGLLLKASNE